MIITRKPGEAFYIGENVIITVVEAAGDKIKIAIDAPREIAVLRKELVDARQLNREAAETGASAIDALRKGLKPVVKPQE